MKTKGLYVIKFVDYDEPVYFIGNNQVSTQLRKAKIYVWKEMAEQQAQDLLQRGRWDRRSRVGIPFVVGKFEIVEVEIKEKGLENESI